MGKAFLAGTACAKVTKGGRTSESGVAGGQVPEHVAGHAEDFGLQSQPHEKGICREAAHSETQVSKPTRAVGWGEWKQGTGSEAPTSIQSKKVDGTGVIGEAKAWGQSLGIPESQNW